MPAPDEIKAVGTYTLRSVTIEPQLAPWLVGDTPQTIKLEFKGVWGEITLQLPRRTELSVEDWRGIEEASYELVLKRKVR